jgi:hypothetical protein
MAITIDLYHQSRGLTHKVGNEWTKSLLPPEFETAEGGVSQGRPEFLFRWRRIPA